jgi:hypothetical protein
MCSASLAATLEADSPTALFDEAEATAPVDHLQVRSLVFDGLRGLRGLDHPSYVPSGSICIFFTDTDPLNPAALFRSTLRVKCGFCSSI